MTADHLLDDLDRDIWQPFVVAYAERDTAAFATLHTPDLIRVEATNAWSGGLDQYLDRVGVFFDDMTAKGGRTSIAFRFAATATSRPRGVWPSGSTRTSAVCGCTACSPSPCSPRPDTPARSPPV